MTNWGQSNRRSERPGGLAYPVIGSIRLFDEAEKAVRQIGIVAMIDRDARLCQAFGVGPSLLAKRIETHGQHDRRGEPTEQGRRRAKRRSERVVSIDRTTEVLLPEPLHIGAGEQRPLGVLVVGVGVEGVVRDRVGE